MKKFVNGYDSPVIIIIENGISETYEFSGRIQSLKEYFTEIGDVTTLVDGSKKKFVSHYEYEWILDYSAFAEADELLKFKEIIQADSRGAQIYLIPHKDLFWRSFHVHISQNKTEIYTGYDVHGSYETENKGFIITFVNADRISELNIGNSDFLPCITSEIYFEF